MEPWLYPTTIFVNLVALTVSLWLSLFLITRAGRSRSVWLATLTLWSVGTWFLYNGLQSSLPNYSELLWLLWLGQGIKFAPALWFHLAYQVRRQTGDMNRGEINLCRLALLASYTISAAQVLDTARQFPSMIMPDEVLSATYFAGRTYVPSYLLFLLLLLALPLWTIWNFYQARASTRVPLLRRQLRHLLLATAVAQVGALYAGFAIYYAWTVPAWPSHAILGLSIVMLGYGVVKFDALLEGRSVYRDALYSSVGIGMVTLCYGLVALVLLMADAMTQPALVTILVFAVITHTLSDAGRTILDRLFYRGHLRQLRTDLRQLANEAGTGNTLAERLGLVLDTVRQRLGVAEGFIAVHQQPSDLFHVTASSEARWRDHYLPSATVATSELVDLLESVVPAHSELTPMTLLVPLAVIGSQNGALVLGARVAGTPYGPEDLDYLETVGHQLALMIETAKQQEGRVQQLEQMMDEYRTRERSLQQQVQQLVTEPVSSPDLPAPSINRDRPGFDEETLTALTEDALRHLHDFAYLGEHRLASLQAINLYLPVSAAPTGAGATALITHLDQGKALQTLLIRTVEQLRPGGASPAAHVVPTREWHPYLILHDSYIQGDLTRDIMARLYIGEGTYNRARRRALRSVAKSLQEMERQLER